MSTSITTVFQGTAFDLTLTFETEPLAIKYRIFDYETNTDITGPTSVTPTGTTATIEILSSEVTISAPEKALNRRAVVITADYQLVPSRQVVEVVPFNVKQVPT